jgi:adenosylhomocysteine nucleosidase
MGRIVVLICSDAEWRATRAAMPGSLPRSSPFGNWSYPLKDFFPDCPHELIFFHTGWGKIAAAAATQYAIQRWSPSLLVNLGTCGGFAGFIDHGEILLVDRTLVYDIDEQMGDHDAAIARYTTTIDLSWLGELTPLPVRRDLLVSADRDLWVKDLRMLQERYGAVAGDWESGAIAYVAARNHIRLLILRAVSDLVGPSEAEAYGNLELYRQSTLEIMPRLIQSLPAWLVNIR